MPRAFELASLLLFSSALVAPSVARAQSAPDDPAAGQATPTVAAPDDQAAEEQPDISIPGANNEIVVVGNRQTNVTKTAPQVVSVLSSADIARTGEGDIAGALAASPASASSATASSMSAASATVTPRRCSTARRCRAPSRSSAWFRSTSSRPT